MGQKVGKACYIDAAVPFLNCELALRPRHLCVHSHASVAPPAVSFAAIEAMWDTFNNVADGFGINSQEFEEICFELGTELDVPKDRLDHFAREVYKAFDTDEVRVLSLGAVRTANTHACVAERFDRCPRIPCYICHRVWHVADGDFGV